MGREKPAEYWFPGPVSSALRVMRAVKILSWDEVGYARLLEEWTGVPVHQSARTVCLTIVGMTAPVLGWDRQVRSNVAVPPRAAGWLVEANRCSWDEPRQQTLGARSILYVLQGVNPPCNKSTHRDTCLLLVG